MNIKLITGASTYEACINTIKQIDVTKKDEYNLLVVPDAFSMQAENLLFDVLDIKAVFNVEVVGISKLAGHILRDNNFSYVRVSGLEEIFSIYKAVKACEKDFQYFGKCDVDLCTKLLQIIKQLKGCKVRPENIKSVSDAVLDRKMHDIRLVYQKYEELLGDKLDLSKLLELCTESVKDGIDLSKTNLFFANFDSFSLEINQFVCQLSKAVNRVCIGMSMTLSQNNAFIFEDDIMTKTTQLAKENSIVVETENFATALDERHQKMAKNLFGFSVEKGQQDDYFLNVIAKNKQDEVEFVAKYIKNAVFSGEKFKNFAVAVPDSAYYGKIKEIFEKYKITFYSDEAVKLSDTILCRFMLKMIEFAKLGLNKERLQYLVNSPFIEVADREKVQKDISFFNVEEQDEFLQRFPVFERLVCQIDLLAKSKTVQEFVGVLKQLTKMVEIVYQNLLSSLEEEKFFKEESQNAQALSLFGQVLEKLEVLGESEQIGIFDFENLLTLALESVKVETIPTYIDAVYVGDATKSYFEDVKTLFVLGATANALPSQRADTGLIDDSDIEKLRLNFLLEPQIKVLNRRSRLKLFECLLHAKEKLVVCVPAVEDGKTSMISGFIKDLRVMFGENVLHTIALEDLDALALSNDQMINNLKFFVGSKENLSNVYALLKSKDKLPSQIEGAILKNLDAQIFEDKKVVALSEQAKDILIRNGKVSASQLETYFNCPYRHFVAYGLKIKERENIEPNKRLFGIFVHALLEKFAKENPGFGSMSQKQMENFINIAVPMVAQEVYDEKILKRKQFLPYLKNEARIILENVIYEQNHSGFSVAMLEERICQSFEGKSNLVGVVDRVDLFENYFRVIDYKTGKTQTIKKDLFYGKKLQLFLYAQALQEKLNLPCSGVYYFDCQTKYAKGEKSNRLNGLTVADDHVVLATDKRLVDDDFKSDLVGFAFKKSAKEGEFSFKGGNPVENFDDLFAYAKKVSASAIKELKEGFILDKPFDGECKTCPYQSVCCHTKEDGFRVLQTVLDENLKGQKSDN